MKHLCECGRPALVLPRGRRGKPRFIPDHDMCWRCWRALRAKEAPKDRPRYRAHLHRLAPRTI